jgi:hypothetical protein
VLAHRRAAAARELEKKKIFEEISDEVSDRRRLLPASVFSP